MSLDDVKRGSVIADEKNNRYLITDVYPKFLRGIDDTFTPVSLGTDWIHLYHKIEDIEMDHFITYLLPDPNLSSSNNEKLVSRG